MFVQLFKSTAFPVDGPNLQFWIVILEQLIKVIQGPEVFEICKPLIVILFTPFFTIGAEAVYGPL